MVVPRRVFVTIALLVAALAPAATIGHASADTLTVQPLTTSPGPGDVVLLQVTSSVPLTQAEVRIADRTIAMWPAAPETADAPSAARVRQAGSDAPRTRRARSQPHAWQALVGLDVGTKAGALVLHVAGQTAAGDRVEAQSTIQVRAKQFGVRRLRVDPRFSEPPAGVRPRIEREARRLDAIYATITRDWHWTPPVIRPVADRTSSPFGLVSVFNGRERGRHNGVDFASPAGTAIHAPAAGRVVLADDLYFTGHTVVIDHGHGLYSVLAHLQRITVQEGADVARGDLVGHVGSTGRSTGPHLHWSVRLQGARVNPLSLVQVR